MCEAVVCKLHASHQIVIILNRTAPTRGLHFTTTSTNQVFVAETSPRKLEPEEIKQREFYADYRNEKTTTDDYERDDETSKNKNRYLAFHVSKHSMFHINNTISTNEETMLRYF